MRMRHLLKPIQKNKMTVISGIIQVARIAYIGYKVSKVVYKAGSKTKQGAQWLSRHPNIAKYGTVAAGGTSLLLDLTNIDYSAIQIPTKSPYQNGQTRGNMEFSRSRSRYGYQYRKPSKRCPPSRQKRRY